MNRVCRRRVLRGMLHGGAVTVGLPLLNCFLDGNGTALADGRPMPIRFGLYSWGLGMSAPVFVPKKTGKDFDIPEEIQALAPLRDQFNLLTNLTAFNDDAPVLGHVTGWVVSRTGAPQGERDRPTRQTWDVRIADQIGRATRFKNLVATASGNPGTSYTYEDPATPVPADYSPVRFYERLFGPDFTDPNRPGADEAGADGPLSNERARLMARKSALSAVMEQAASLNRRVGVEDRVRLDQYFTGLRHLEKQLELQLTAPEAIGACHAPARPSDGVEMGDESAHVAERNRLMSDLLAMAVACDQTRMITMAYSDMSAKTVRPGLNSPHHATTHEESIDEKLGYRPNCSWFTRRAMEGFAYFLQAFAAIKEGDGALLDNMFIVADSDHSDAFMHSVEKMAVFTAGRAGGRLKTGLHLDMKGAPMSRVALTALRTAGVEAGSFGAGTNQTSAVVSDILV